MSIVLPDDPPETRRRKSRSSRNPRPAPLLARIRGLELWQFLTRPYDLPDLTHFSEPTGKIRLVTNRWDDRTSKNRCRDRKS